MLLWDISMVLGSFWLVAMDTGCLGSCWMVFESSFGLITRRFEFILGSLWMRSTEHWAPSARRRAQGAGHQDTRRTQEDNKTNTSRTQYEHRNNSRRTLDEQRTNIRRT